MKSGFSQDITRRGTLGLGAMVLGTPALVWPLGKVSLVHGDEILVNQIGFLKDAPKQIALRSKGRSKAGKVNFDVMDARNDRRAGRLETKAVGTDDPHLATANISSLQLVGTFYLKSGDIRSPKFTISTNVFENLNRSLLRAFYLQRCGVALKDPITGLSHAPCHTKDALSVGGSHRDCTGGWHDAGDFGKYVATTSVSIGEILSLYEDRPGNFSDGEMDLPESGDGVPDILSEMRVGLGWLLKMQKTYGPFNRKVAGRQWPSMTAYPQADVQERFAYGLSTGDTAKAAAALAIASRVYKSINSSEARRYLLAAEEAWIYLKNHPSPTIERETSDDTGSGAYFDDEKADQKWDVSDRLWMAAELYLATGNREYAQEVARRIDNQILWPASWANPSSIGMLNLLRDGRLIASEDLRQAVRGKLLSRADEFEKTSQVSPWGVADLHFGWGSNRNIAARGRILLAAFEETGEEKYLKAATAQANYILGQNPNAISYVSGSGTTSPQNLHHRLLIASRTDNAGTQIPGLLVGGANEEASAANLSELEPAARYRDDPASFETNEFAIDNNAALLSLLGRMSSLRQTTKPGFFTRLRRRVGL
jgi:endoglucanase